jgi:hypothetical protein
LKFHPAMAAKSVVCRPLVAMVVGFTSLSMVSAGVVSAEPNHDSVANLDDLARQSDELANTINAAQQDLDRKLQLVAEADNKQAADLAALDAARAQLATYQGSVNNLAAAVYMGGRIDVQTALLTAASPTNLIDKLSIQRVMGTEMAEQMKSYRRVDQEAQIAATASAVSAAEARATADEAAALRADLRRKQSELQTQINQAKARYMLLPPAEQRAQAPSPAVVKALGLINPVPTVGMGGLVPNARSLAAYIIATYPGVRSIGGVRPDPLPDHPSGRAIDIMLDDMALGDVILADIQSQAARFGVDYTLWRVAAHFDHIHVTVR